MFRVRSARVPRAPPPAIMTARRTVAGDAFPARATASINTPSSAPCRSSPVSSRTRKSCSSAVARVSRSRRRRARSPAEPLPVVVAICSNTLSTSTSERTGAGAAVTGFDSRMAEMPIPIRPCRGSPDKNAAAMSTSGGVTRWSRAASSAILTRRLLALATAALVVTSS